MSDSNENDKNSNDAKIDSNNSNNTDGSTNDKSNSGLGRGNIHSTIIRMTNTQLKIFRMNIRMFYSHLYSLNSDLSYTNMSPMEHTTKFI